MKKLNVLSRSEMKFVLGGGPTMHPIGIPGGDNGNPCASGGACDTGGGVVSHENSDGSYGWGNCDGAQGCHNYCSGASGGAFWC